MATEKEVDEKSLETYKQYEKHCNEKDFWDKVANVAKALGKTVLEKALVLYYVWKYPESIIDTAKKALIAGALGYFILPIDIVPDFIPGFGLADDAAALAAVYAVIMKALAEHPTAQKKIEEEAQAKLKEWFKDDEK